MKQFRKPVVTNSVTSKKKDQDKFNEYAINTDDAWEIDDRAMTLKMLDNDNNGDDTDHQSEHLNISKEVLLSSIIKFKKQNSYISFIFRLPMNSHLKLFNSTNRKIN